MGQLDAFHYYKFMPTLILLAVIKSTDYLVQIPCLRTSGKLTHSERPKVITVN